MEDSVTETEKLVAFSSKNDVEKEEIIGGETMEKEEQEVEEKSSGFIHQLISNLVPAGQEKHDEEHDKGHVEIEGHIGDKGKEGGLFSNMISNLVSPSSTPRVKEPGGDEDEKQSEDGGKGGGIMDNFVSHLPKPLLGMSCICSSTLLIDFLILYSS